MHYLVRRNTGISVTWAAFAVVCVLFALLPWAIIASKRRVPTGPAVLFLVAWSAFPLALGIYLLFWAMCRIELSGTPGRVSRRASWLLLATRVDYRINRAYLVRQWYDRKNRRDVPRDVLFIRAGRRKHRLADELTCADLPGLLGWIGDVTHVRTFDARHRRPVGN
jgi:hypothetical protein